MSNPWKLTARQVDCMTCLVGISGGCNKLVARNLGIDVRTVDTHMARAFKRMGVKTRIQAAIQWDRWARQQEAT